MNPVQAYRHFQARRKNTYKTAIARSSERYYRMGQLPPVPILVETLDEQEKGLYNQALLYEHIRISEAKEYSPIQQMRRRRSTIFDMVRAEDFKSPTFTASLIEALANLTKEINANRI